MFQKLHLYLITLQDLSTSPPSSTPEIMSKKGWLMKLGLTKEWHKYWFVLQDVALLYYRDPAAESMVSPYITSQAYSMSLLAPHDWEWAFEPYIPEFFVVEFLNFHNSILKYHNTKSMQYWLIIHLIIYRQSLVKTLLTFQVNHLNERCLQPSIVYRQLIWEN